VPDRMPDSQGFKSLPRHLVVISMDFRKMLVGALLTSILALPGYGSSNPNEWDVHENTCRTRTEVVSRKPFYETKRFSLHSYVGVKRSKPDYKQIDTGGVAIYRK